MKAVQQINQLTRKRKVGNKGGLPSVNPRQSIEAHRTSATIVEASEEDEALLGDVVELYSVTSQIVTDPSGNWEFPDNFPTSNSYPGESEGPDTSVYLISERTHELGVINSDGVTQVLQFQIAWETPYTGETYTPEYTFTQGTSKEGYKEAFEGVDWESIKSTVAQRYPGISL